MQGQTSAVGQVPAAQSETRLRAPRRQRASGLDPDLEWLLTCGDAALGARGTLAGTIAALERGGGSTGSTLDESGCFIHPYTDAHVGLGGHVFGDVEKHRWLINAWRKCDRQTQAALAVRYNAPRAAYRSDEGYGARDRYVEGSDGQPGHEWQRRTGVEAQLGELAGLALALCEDAGRLLVACQDPNRRGQRKVIVAALRVAKDADERAHAAWFEAKGNVRGMRKRNERRKVLPAHVPGEAAE
jgi:hypothetical protein